MSVSQSITLAARIFRMVLAALERCFWLLATEPPASWLPWADSLKDKSALLSGVSSVFSTASSESGITRRASTPSGDDAAIAAAASSKNEQKNSMKIRYGPLTCAYDYRVHTIRLHIQARTFLGKRRHKVTPLLNDYGHSQTVCEALRSPFMLLPGLQTKSACAGPRPSLLAQAGSSNWADIPFPWPRAPNPTPMTVYGSGPRTITSGVLFHHLFSNVP
jgi:hypothetical protein